MVLKIYYKSPKIGKVYYKNARSYKQLDELAVSLKKQGYEIVGANYYN